MNEKDNFSCQHIGCCKFITGVCGGCCRKTTIPNFTSEETAFLELLSCVPFLPIGRFVLRSSRFDHLESVALAPLYLVDCHDSMEVINENAKILKTFEKYGFITLDYDMPLENCDYKIFHESAAFRCFQKTVSKGRRQQGFIFDVAAMELGSLALTGLGQDVLDIVERISRYDID